MARTTYKTKTAAKRAAHGREIYRVKGPPRGWRISRGRKVRGARGRAQRARARARTRTKVKKRKRKRKKSKKKGKRYIITIGNPNPSICGFPE